MKKIMILCFALSSTTAFGSAPASAPVIQKLEKLKEEAIKFCDRMDIYYINQFKDLPFNQIKLLKQQCYANAQAAQKVEDLDNFVASEKQRWTSHYNNAQKKTSICSEPASIKKLTASQKQIDAELHPAYFSTYNIPKLINWAHSQPEFINDAALKILNAKLGEVIFPPTLDTFSGTDLIQAAKIGFSFNENNRFKPGEFVIIPRPDAYLILAIVLGKSRYVDPDSTTREEIVIDPDALSEDGLYMIAIDSNFTTMKLAPARIGKITPQVKAWLVEIFSPKAGK